MKYLTQIFRNNSHEFANWVVISANKSCPCQKLFNLLVRLDIKKNSKIINVNDETSNALIYAELNNGKNLAVAVHGKKDSSLAYYKSDASNYEAVKVIEPRWWNKLAFGQSILYFHVCNGVNILRGGKLQELFPNWISYNDEIAHTISGNELVKQKSEKFLRIFNGFFQNETDVEIFYTQTRNLYIDIINELNEYEGIESVDIHMALLQFNLDSLDSSIKNSNP